MVSHVFENLRKTKAPNMKVKQVFRRCKLTGNLIYCQYTRFKGNESLGSAGRGQ
jgi:hypothetical protein